MPRPAQPPVPAGGSGQAGGGRWRAVAALAGDVAVVLAFVAIGRASHHDGETLPGLADTAWPFLAGLAAGWLACRAWRSPCALAPAGVTVLAGAVAIGMALRVVAGQGSEPAFVAVATAFLGLGLLGWRAGVGAAGMARRLRAAPGPVRKGSDPSPRSA